MSLASVGSSTRRFQGTMQSSDSFLDLLFQAQPRSLSWSGEYKITEPEDLKSCSLSRIDPGQSLRSKEGEGCVFKVGETARLHSLKSAAELNGQIVTCKEFVERTGRWLVRIIANGEEKNVKPENLEVAEVLQTHASRSPSPNRSSRKFIGDSQNQDHLLQKDKSKASVMNLSAQSQQQQRQDEAETKKQNLEKRDQKSGRWARTLNKDLLGKPDISTKGAPKDPLIGDSIECPLIADISTTIDSETLLPPLVCLPISSGEWGEFQFPPDSNDAAKYMFGATPRVVNNVSEMSTHEANGKNFGSFDQGLREERSRSRDRSESEGSVSTPSPLRKTHVHEHVCDDVHPCKSTLIASSQDWSRSRSRNRSRSRSQSEHSIATPSPLRELPSSSIGNHFSGQQPKRRVLSEDVHDKIPFPLLVCGSGKHIQCDGCAIWLEVHEEVMKTYGAANNCPFYCSCLGLPVCSGEDPDVDDLQYMAVVKGMKRVRSQRNRLDL